MKKTLLYILAAITLGTGCRKTYNDTIGGQTPDERIAAALAAYNNKLTSSPYGWMLIESTTGVAYNQGVSQTGPKIVLAYFMQFTADNKVNMYSDFDTSMIGTPKSSGWRTKALQRPVLIFDTYSYIHVPCDPDPNVSKSPYGTGYGWGTDFEYSFADSVGADKLGDTIRLTGNLNSASAILVKATQAQRDAYTSGGAKSRMLSLNQTNNILEYFKRLTIGGTTYDIRFDPVNRTITFTWSDGTNVKTATVNYYVTGTGIVFNTPIVNGSQKLTGIDNIVWDGGSSSLAVTIGSQQGTIVGAIAPVKVDLGAPARWWNYSASNDYLWASWSAFHVNGVDDAYGVTQLSNASGTFYFYAYWANYFTNPADLFGPVMLNGNSLAFNSYLSAPRKPTFTTDGRAVFTALGGIGTTPAGGPVAKTNAQLYNAAGYYFVQTGDLTYDMVVASDARAWISWFWPQ
ncbi:MAG: DUF4302 domain-containing protein [Bacteroidetes bacterium]|nr:DUF4302 domain-containing protein [Bacteroidota bacterium]